ncbi:unknown protein [Microcystis aeruginosa NIES-843]|uniref:Uncharacterized protein n=1 Tax=Microcystis aeruginosa (strain NIES-843 / IAM M-2473) TaxID=449447 RepID=B0JPS6_MICAN|nr:unknown protein [Microcystis aeruginosa NIES-843]
MGASRGLLLPVLSRFSAIPSKSSLSANDFYRTSRASMTVRFTPSVATIPPMCNWQ